MQTIAYVLAPIVLLVAAHILVTIELNVAPLYLRLASVIIPQPFGVALYARQKIKFGGALLVGTLTAALAVTCMLMVTAFNDNVPIIPGPWIEWREVIEYIASIALAYVTGNLLGFLILNVLPKTITHGGKPNALAYKIARHAGPARWRGATSSARSYYSRSPAYGRPVGWHCFHGRWVDLRRP